MMQQVLTPTSPIASIAAPCAATQVSDAQLHRYAELIYARTGIRISPQKKTLLSNRLRRRLRSTGIGDFEAYYRHLMQLPPEDREWDAFLQEITTHETYLFRDETQWEWLCKEYLPAITRLAKPASDGRFQLRVWSAACSTGDEAYTAGCCIAATLPELRRWQVQILGTDIGVGALEQARAGAFNQRAMRLVPDDHRRRFFTHDRGEPSWRIQPAISRMVAFRRHNLMEPLRERAFDLVFLKNVLIYFNEQSKTTVLRHVRDALRPGGLLVIGMAEGVADLLRDCERLKPWLYRKPPLK